MQVEVNVTQEHIANGIRGICSLCPITLAVRDVVTDAVPGISSDFWDVIGYSSAHPARTNVELFRAPLPPVAGRFIQSFDDEKPVHPFSFSLEIPAKYVKVP